MIRRSLPFPLFSLPLPFSLSLSVSVSRRLPFSRSACVALACLAFAAQPAFGLDERDCRLEHSGLPAAFGKCATLVVPESYAEPDAATIDLFVARIPALTATPAPDPLVLINGGPGGSGVDLFLQARNAFEPILRDRDVILLDQRGTGRSRAGLECEVPSDLELETADPDALRAAVDDCIGSFTSDPRQFTTSVAVRDLDTLRRALGATRWNLYGISYGTRVAQHYLRRYPEHVRAVILDGVVPADLALGPGIAADAQAALDAIFARCLADEACGERFDGIDRKFAELDARLARTPIELEIMDPATGAPVPFELTDVHLKAVARLMSYAATTASLLPLVIDEAHAGNYRPLAGQADILVESISESLSFAMHNSVVCAEDTPFFDDASGDTDSDPVRGADGDARGDAADPYLGTMIVDSLTAICELWPVGVRDEDFKAPVESDRPVLILSGENDPVTPPVYGERIIAAGLGNAVHVIGFGQGHGLAAIGCVPRLMRDFLAAPDPGSVDRDCLDREPPTPFFLSFQGPAP